MSPRIRLTLPPLLVAMTAAGATQVDPPHPSVASSATSSRAIDRTAIDAARLDARLALVDQIRRLRIGPTLTVTDLLLTEPQIAWRLPTTMNDVRYGPARAVDQERVEVVAELSMADAAESLRALAAEYYTGTLISIEGIVGLPRFNGPGPLRATGIGTAAPAPDRIPVRQPAWALSRLTARGVARITTGGATADVIARAQFDARRNLALAIDKLEIAAGRTVRPILLAHPEWAPDLDKLLRDATETGPPSIAEDGVTTVEVGIPGMRLWQLIRPYASDALADGKH